MTFPPDDEYGELLRRALRAEADSVVPSPDGLEIIRGRIDQRGLRGLRHMLWWRVGAAAAGAVLVAGAVVMVVPDLRDQVAQSTGIAPAGDEREDKGDTSSVTRPPHSAPSQPVVIVPVTPSPSRQRPSPSPTRKTGATTRPSPSPSDPCVTSTPQPGVIEPDAALPPTCSPASVTQQPPVVTPSASRRPSSAPHTKSAPPVTPSTTPPETTTPDPASPTPSP